MLGLLPVGTNWRIVTRSLDSRGAKRGKAPVYHYEIDTGECDSQIDRRPRLSLNEKPIIVGAGPAGLFAALRFAEYGIPTRVIERGARMDRRVVDVARFWKTGLLDPHSNVCYGEGGAGLFSDGKLLTRVKSPYVKDVLHMLVRFGAPEETLFDARPHIGSNRMRRVIAEIRDYLESQGHELHFRCHVEELIIEKDAVVGVRCSEGRVFHSPWTILATGHSASDVYRELHSHHVKMKPKDFAVGVRIEHPRALIDTLQYGPFAGDSRLGAAAYSLTYESPTTRRGVFSFCMCPGGLVLSSGTESDGLVTNGMSNYGRRSPWSNAALIVAVRSGVDFNSDDLMAGLHFQRQIEQRARLAVPLRVLPAMRVDDFLKGRLQHSALSSSTPSGVQATDLTSIFPPFIVQHLREALHDFDKKIHGFKSEPALLLAPETRTSAPLTIERNPETLESCSHRGLYPCGEGAGYAGGITSAAVDGVRAVMAILKKEKGLIE